MVAQLTSAIKSEEGQTGAAADFEEWLEAYAARLIKAEERSAWEQFKLDESAEATVAYGPVATHGDAWLAKRETEVRRWNPRFVLRQWVLEETIGELEERKDIKERRAVLARILEVSSFAVSANVSRCRADHSTPGARGTNLPLTSKHQRDCAVWARRRCSGSSAAAPAESIQAFMHLCKSNARPAAHQLLADHVPPLAV